MIYRLPLSSTLTVKSCALWFDLDRMVMRVIFKIMSLRHHRLGQLGMIHGTIYNTLRLMNLAINKIVE
jgi:hypothetical protein